MKTGNLITDNPISKIGLDYIEKSPLDYWYKFLNPEREPYIKDDQTIFDEAFRLAVMDFPGFQKHYVKMPSINTRTTIGKAELASLNTAVQKEKQILLTAHRYDTIIKMREAVLSHPTAKTVFKNGHIGFSEVFMEENSGAMVVFRPHWIHKQQLIVNLTSTKDASEENFSKEAWNFKYHKKAALQMDGMGIEQFVFVMVEEKAPYKLQVHMLNERSIDLGRSTYFKNCQTYIDCLEANKWPGLPEKILQTSLPNWAFKNY